MPFVRNTAQFIAPDHHGPLVTPNERLARELSRSLDAALARSGAGAWIPRQVISWRALLRQLWGDRTEVLSSAGLKLALRQSAPPGALGALKDAVDAWRLSHQYGLDSHQTRAWFSQTQELLQQLGCISEAELDDAACELPPPDSRVTLIGFEHLSPAQNRLLAHWQARGCAVDHHPPDGKAGPLQRVVFATPEQEIAAAAWWTRRTMEAHPSATVGILVPDLNQRHAAVTRQFAAVLDPANGSRTGTFDIASGSSLHATPLWQDAERVLQGLHRTLAAREIDRLARSRHFAWHPIAHALPWLLDWASYLQRYDDKQLQRAIDAWAEGPPADAKRSLREWIRRDLTLLNTLGWARSATGSAVYQTHQAVIQTLHQLASQTTATSRVAHDEALRLYNATLADVTFGVQRAPAPVQVLGYLESTGLSFTHLWVAGLDDTALPAAPSPNPLFPVSDLVSAGVPRMDHASELAFAQSRLLQWSAAAPEVIVSHAQQAPGGASRPSPLIRAIDATSFDELFSDQAPPLSTHAYQPTVETLQPLAKPWTATQLPAGRLPGGSGLLQAQSSCPFQAFARYRLGIDAPRQAHTFADALQVGTLIHSALEQLFKQFPNAAAIADAGSQTILDVLAEQTTPLAKFWPSSVTDQFTQWLAQRIAAWIAYDLENGLGNTALLESEHYIELGGYTVKAVVDRLDKHNDQWIVIDYKTGTVPSDNQVLSTDEQMQQTQLPLYALIDPAVRAVLYAKVHEPPAYSGVMDESGLSVGRAKRVSNWDTLVSTWRGSLTQLAQHYAAGDATPTPVQARLCTNCGARNLCRNPADRRG